MAWATCVTVEAEDETMDSACQFVEEEINGIPIVAVLAIRTLISSFLLGHICGWFGLCNSLGGHICGDSYEG